MNDWVNAFLTRCRDIPDSHDIKPRVFCADGYALSIQASSSHYCEPRIDNSETGYTKVELGFPSDPDDLILPYAEDKDDPTRTVYPYVPTNVVNKLIEKHGGLYKSRF